MLLRHYKVMDSLHAFSRLGHDLISNHLKITPLYSPYPTFGEWYGRVIRVILDMNHFLKRRGVSLFIFCHFFEEPCLLLSKGPTARVTHFTFHISWWSVTDNAESHETPMRVLSYDTEAYNRIYFACKNDLNTLHCWYFRKNQLTFELIQVSW